MIMQMHILQIPMSQSSINITEKTVVHFTPYILSSGGAKPGICSEHTVLVI